MEIKKKTCKCGKVIEGLSDSHVEYLIKQHMLSDKHNENMKKFKKASKEAGLTK